MARLITEPEEINQLYEFIKKHTLDYPDYMIWIKKCFRELQLGYKKAIVAKDKDRIIAGIIFQEDKRDSRILELKNGRVNAKYRMRGIFKTIIKKIDDYAKQNSFKKIQCDSHNKDVIKTLKKLGFVIEAEETLYSSEKLETILSKEL